MNTKNTDGPLCRKSRLVSGTVNTKTLTTSCAGILEVYPEVYPLNCTLLTGVGRTLSGVADTVSSIVFTAALAHPGLTEAHRQVQEEDECSVEEVETRTPNFPCSTWE